ncbi:MAG: TIGR03790 family protein [Candidatus Woesearchaeota archaeon]
MKKKLKKEVKTRDMRLSSVVSIIAIVVIVGIVWLAVALKTHSSEASQAGESENLAGFAHSSQDFASQSERPSYNDVLVVYNTRSADSQEIASYYAELNKIPSQNILGLDIVEDETIGYTYFKAEIYYPIKDYLENSMLKNKINYIVLAKDIPHRISNQRSVDNLLVLGLHNLNYIENYNPPPKMNNPYYKAKTRFNSAQYQMYIVSRLDGYTKEDVFRLIDDAHSSFNSLNRENSLFVFNHQSETGDPGEPGLNWQEAVQLLEKKGFNVLEGWKDPLLINKENVMGYLSYGQNDMFNKKYSHIRQPDNEWLAGAIALPFVSTSARTFEKPEDDFGVQEWNEQSYDNGRLSQLYGNSVTDFYHANDFLADTAGAKYVKISLGNNIPSESGNPSAVFRIRVYGTAEGKGGVALLSSCSLGAQITEHSEVINPASIQQLICTNNVQGFRVEFADIAQDQYIILKLIDSATEIYHIDLMAAGPRPYEFKSVKIWISEDNVNWAKIIDDTAPQRNFIEGSPQDLVADLVEEGVTGVMGFAYEPYKSAMPKTEYLFERYIAQGFTLGESFFIASPYSMWTYVLVGDPKASVRSFKGNSALPMINSQPDTGIILEQHPAKECYDNDDQYQYTDKGDQKSMPGIQYARLYYGPNAPPSFNIIGFFPDACYSDQSGEYLIENYCEDYPEGKPEYSKVVVKKQYYCNCEEQTVIIHHPDPSLQEFKYTIDLGYCG